MKRKILLILWLWIIFSFWNSYAINFENYKNLIPAYWWSYELNKDLLKLDQHSSIVIINPSNGDFNKSEDVFKDEINKTHQNNNLAIWYFYTKYGKRDLDKVKSVIDKRLKYYPNIDGFFVDETADTKDKINYYKEIYNYIKQKDASLVVVLNPWTTPDKWYFNISDNIVVYENPCKDYEDYDMPDWLKSYKDKISFLWYSCSKKQYINLKNKYWDYKYYFTNDWDDWNPWDSLSNYLLEDTFPDIHRLDNWENKIGPATYKNKKQRLKIWEKGAIDSKYANENMEGSYSYASYNGSHLNIKCKNWHIVKISSSYIDSPDPWQWNIESVKITYWNWSDDGSIIWSFKATCKPIAKPIEKIEKITNINYKNIIQKENDFSPKFPITDTKVDITDEDIEKHFKPKQDIDNQPTFTDIVYLQLDLIWNLASSVENTKEDFDFANLFKTDEDFKNYNAWLNKFWNYTDKKDFQDAMSWAITLKDIWVAQDVIKWLYECTNNDNCTWTIIFKKNPMDKYETYSLDDLQNQLYLSEWNILDNSIKYYKYLSLTCNNLSSINDNFLKKQTENICKEILKQNIDDTNEADIENYNLWYAIGKRVENIKTLKTKFATLKTWVNLLGIYNVYHELTNLNVWLDKISHIKKAKTETNLTLQYKTIGKIFEKEAKDIEDKKKVTDSVWKRKAKIKAMEKMFTPWTKLHEVAETVPELDVTEDVGTEEVGGKDLIILKWSTIVWDDIADIYNLGSKYWWNGNDKNWTITDDIKTKTINLWIGYKWKIIKLSFNLKYHWWWENGKNDCRKYYKEDYFKIKVNDDPSSYINKDICIKPNKHSSYKSSNNKSIKLQLDGDWKANIQFIVWSTTKYENVNIKDITYKIVN